MKLKRCEMTPYKPSFLLSVDVSSASSETLNYGLFNMFCSVVKSKMYELTEAKKKKKQAPQRDDSLWDRNASNPFHFSHFSHCDHKKYWFFGFPYNYNISGALM